MLLRIDHETKLTYTAPVTETVINVRKSPQSSEDQTVVGHRLRTLPSTTVISYRDGFGNRVDLFSILPPHAEVVIQATSYVRVHRRPGRARLAMIPWPGEQPVDVEAIEFLQASPLVYPNKQLSEFLERLPRPQGSLADVVDMLMTFVRQRLKYEKQVTTARTSLEEALTLGRGVCQDFTHLFLGAARGLGLPARYVSGYVNQPGEIATHAWAQVWGGNGIGWVDVDPTQSKWVEDDHVVTALGRDYADVPPNRGVWRGRAEETITVTVKVQPVERMPLDGSEPSVQPAWSIPTFSQVQRQTQNRGLNHQVRTRKRLRHQQGQQQQ